MLTEETIFNSLSKKPYFHVEFPLDKSQLKEAVIAFLKFIEQPDLLKNYISFKICNLHRRGEVGFKHRNSADDFYNDNKDFFHFHPLIIEKYQSFLNENPVILDFMMKAQPIWYATYDIINEITRLMDNRFPGTNKKIFNSKSVHIILRFLKYTWVNSGEYLAKPHFDAGSFTLAIAESCNGLRIGKGPESLEMVNHRDNHAIFMISSNFKKVINNNKFFAGWHDVVQYDKTQIGRPFARWAIVAFIDGANVKALPKSETHKWYKQTVT